ncbi:MAG: hypothetical protein ACWIPH_04650 [Ostreibacterium sp.]
MKKVIPIFLFIIFLTSCSNYFSNYRTVYRIETTDGERYYSENEPNLNQSEDEYDLIDLDGNQYHIPKTRFYKVEKYKHRK